MSSSAAVTVSAAKWSSAGGNSAPKAEQASTAASRGLEFEFPKPTTKLGKSDRGLVISRPIRIEGTKLEARGSLDVHELRFALLFWDRLDFPKNPDLNLGSGPDFEFLISAGVAQRSFAKLRGKGGDVAAITKAAHVAAFRNLDTNQPGVWSLSRGVNSVSFQEDDLDFGRGLLFKLHRAVPIPDRDVPLADILDFKVSPVSDHETDWANCLRRISGTS